MLYCSYFVFIWSVWAFASICIDCYTFRAAPFWASFHSDCYTLEAVALCISCIFSLVYIPPAPIHFVVTINAFHYPHMLLIDDLSCVCVNFVENVKTPQHVPFCQGGEAVFKGELECWHKGESHAFWGELWARGSLALLCSSSLGIALLCVSIGIHLLVWSVIGVMSFVA